uniref:Uncharacterized protein n=1 Tax=Rhizophora mucronata TaxID=61149 RepID=A0A2P2NST2_RHIMU
MTESSFMFQYCCLKLSGEYG